MILHPPQSRAEVTQMFGDISDPDFETKHIVMFEFPFPMRFGTQPANRGRCHRLAVDNFVAALTESEQWLKGQEYGGCYCKRNVSGGSKPSLHSWGLAIDLMPNSYPLGGAARIPQGVIDAFHKYGLFYGGDFHRPDPMHFQLAGDF